MKAKKCKNCGRAYEGGPATLCPLCLPVGLRECENCGTITPRAKYCETCEAHGWLNPSTADNIKMPKVPESADKYFRHEQICKELNKTYVDKNTAYGDSFGRTFKELGIISAVTRMEDKMCRIKSLVTGAENRVKDEKLEDTLKDLANYAVMTLIELEGQKNDK